MKERELKSTVLFGVIKSSFCSDGCIICDYTKNHWTVWFKLVICSGSVVKNLSAMQETQVPSLGWKDPLEEGMATHSSILAWRTPWTEEPGGLQFMESWRAGHDWSDWAQHTHGSAHLLSSCQKHSDAGFVHSPLSKGFDSADGSQWLWMTSHEPRPCNFPWGPASLVVKAWAGCRAGGPSAPALGHGLHHNP